MRNRRCALILALVVTVLYSAPAGAGPVIYTTGPVGGYTNAYFVGAAPSPFLYQYIGDSFTSAASTTVGSFEVGLWVPAGTTPSSLTWDIAVGTPSFFVPGTSTIASGTADISGGASTRVVAHNPGGYDVYLSTVSGLSVPVSTGVTYYLDLRSVTGTWTSDAAWDWTTGAGGTTSVVWGKSAYSLFPVQDFHSETFTVFGPSVPLPPTALMLGTGLIGLVLARFKKRMMK